MSDAAGCFEIGGKVVSQGALRGEAKSSEPPSFAMRGAPTISLVVDARTPGEIRYLPTGSCQTWSVISWWTPIMIDGTWQNAKNSRRIEQRLLAGARQNELSAEP